jgi:hypothetical protein
MYNGAILLCMCLSVSRANSLEYAAKHISMRNYMRLVQISLKTFHFFRVTHTTAIHRQLKCQFRKLNKSKANTEVRISENSQPRLAQLEKGRRAAAGTCIAQITQRF